MDKRILLKLKETDFYKFRNNKQRWERYFKKRITWEKYFLILFKNSSLNKEENRFYENK